MVAQGISSRSEIRVEPAIEIRSDLLQRSLHGGTVLNAQIVQIVAADLQIVFNVAAAHVAIVRYRQPLDLPVLPECGCIDLCILQILHNLQTPAQLLKLGQLLLVGHRLVDDMLRELIVMLQVFQTRQKYTKPKTSSGR